MAGDADEQQTGGIQSLDAALRVLGAMGARRGPASLSELARECGMPPSKVHRYLASFQHAGLVVQAGRSGKYDLGRGAAALGLSALSRHDFVNRASDLLPELRDETGLTVLLSVWGNLGATVIRWERAAVPMVTSMGLGTILPLLNSATGRAFLAWAPRPPLEAVLEAEMREARRNPALAPGPAPTPASVEATVADIRAQGHASIEGRFIPGLVAVAAPVLDWQGEAQAVVTLVGADPTLARSDSAAVRQLVAFCGGLSFAPVMAGRTP